MRVMLVINEQDLRDALVDVNDDKRQSGDPNKLTLAQVKAKLKDADYLRGAASDAERGRCLRDLRR